MCSASRAAGDLTYVPLISESYWLISLESVAVSGTTVTTTSASAAVDTGTTLVGGPTAVVASIFAAIPGAEALTGDYKGCQFIAPRCLSSH